MTQELFTYLGGLVAVGNLLWFAGNLWWKKIPPQSPASWLMWTLLDVVVTITTHLAGKPFWLPLGYTIGAATITIVLFLRGAWTWSWKETLCAAGVVAATYTWLVLGPVKGVGAGVVAMTVAGIPLFLDMVHNPIRKTFPVWVLTCVACICTLLGSDWTFTGTILAWSGLTFNGLLAVIVLRGR